MPHLFNWVTNLGYVAVKKAVFIIHDEVLEILGREHLPLPLVAQTRLLQQLPAVLEGLLSRHQLQLLGGRRTKQQDQREKT